jgi:hypothetical protein
MGCQLKGESPKDREKREQPTTDLLFLSLSLSRSLSLVLPHAHALNDQRHYDDDIPVWTALAVIVRGWPQAQGRLCSRSIAKISSVFVHSFVSIVFSLYCISCLFVDQFQLGGKQRRKKRRRKRKSSPPFSYPSHPSLSLSPFVFHSE